MNPARLTVKNGIGVITLNQAPVNAMNQPMRAALAAAIAEAGDAQVDAVVIIGENGLFSAGADLNEVERGLGSANFYEAVGKPDANDVFNTIEDFPRPVVAAVDGLALGGGMELALACHFRVALDRARFGLTEAKLGIMPGAGGTQRLPRLTGVEKAMELMMDGAVINAAAARSLGVVDAIVEGDLLASALAFARAHADQPVRPVSRRNELLANVPGSIFEDAYARAARKPHLLGPRCIVDAVKLAATVPFSEALAREWEFFRECAGSEAASGLIHHFLSGRRVWKIPGLAKDTLQRQIERAAVIGSGTMGAGITMSLLDADIPVRLLDASQASLDKGIERIRSFYAGSVAKGRLSQAQADHRIALLSPVSDYAGIADVDLVIEAVFERMDVKQSVFRELDRHVRAGAILATNTSTLDVDQIAAVTNRPGDVIGLHFFSPANIMRLVEIVRAEKTADDVLATSQGLCRRMRKVGVVVGICDGFVGNRMVDPYLREAQELLLEGATPAEVDSALTDFGLAMGVFAMLDMAGLDVRWDVEKRRIAEGSWPKDAPMLIQALVDAGSYGQKSGAGFFRYEKGNRAPLLNPQLQPLVAAEVARLGIKPRDNGAEEITRRCLYGMINEAAKILQEGIALRASDIDVIYTAGYGFPAWRGGPMKYADTVGLRALLATVEDYYRRYGERWRPADLLVRLAREGSSFAEHDRNVAP
ncbi:MULTISPECIES: 3-hydroxyacyl-CoA dehydrogenase NAD-binding domain-containing protein [unclassified Chelatococcus]|uniref:3-hydroxyacyl-CoA dehydrogenase NAD-binding domain-containing protein n=1 Tax=unclassified Chelatococcus TaxID=2638111 RepID=UPI001BCFA1FF|nr:MULTISPECIES: 3-hydroxyacyl-CoA dehydrogenase NAD-binding domain-containing protein [unclassified Chelatococcus]MBS7700634.1 enoyl-CoA hydratase/isomerase family protein [Chelatococcus sp. YT9]MBX3559065.1 enoyl-CoA hydratase/isomerase family protein [Chelatococcus sp.]